MNSNLKEPVIAGCTLQFTSLNPPLPPLDLILPVHLILSPGIEL